MGMCKKCGKVFNVLDMKDGVCKNCQPEDDERSEPSYKQNLLNMLADGTILKRKCYFIQFLLASFFGPLGLLYSSVTAAIVMIAVAVLIIVYINVSHPDAPAILNYSASYVIIVITNVLSVSVGFFTVYYYNKRQIKKHTKMLNAIIQSVYGAENLKSDFENNEDDLDNLASTTLGTGTRLLIIGLVVFVLIIGYQMNKTDDSSANDDVIQNSTYEEAIKNGTFK